MVIIAGCLIVRDNKILMVKEAKKKIQFKGSELTFIKKID